MINIMDRLFTKGIVFLGKWLMLTLLFFLGLFVFYFTYTEIFSTGWTVSSISIAEVFFIVFSILLIRRILRKSALVGVSRFYSLSKFFVFLGGYFVFLLVVFSLLLLSLFDSGVDINKVVKDLLTEAYEYYLIDYIVVLFFMYLAAPVLDNLESQGLVVSPSDKKDNMHEGGGQESV